MANSLTAASPTYWASKMGRKFYNTVIFRAITSFTEQSLLKGNGLIVDRPYRSSVVAEDYSKGTALTAQDMTATSDTLTMDKFYSLLMYTDKVDRLQTKWDTVRLWSEEAGRRIAVRFDGDVLYEAVNANSTVDASDLGGTADEGITITASNVADVFAEVNEYLDNLNIPDDERFFAISPMFFSKLWKYLQGKESQLGDRTAENGNVGRYGGMKLYKTTNICSEATWTPADNPTTAATVVMESITFTFIDTIGTTAGNILQTTSLAATIALLVAFINGGGLETATGCTAATCQSLSTANQRTVQNWVAVDNSSLSITVRFKGTLNPVLTSSESADTWDAKYEFQNLLAGRKYAIDAAIQTDPMIDVEMGSTVSAGKHGTNVMPLLVGGVETFNQGLNEIVRVKVRTDS